MPDLEVMFYHARPLVYCEPEEVRQVQDVSDIDSRHYELAYQWLVEKLGFYGVFLAVGGEDAISMTGYRNQFSRMWREGARPEHQNQVLFGYRDVPQARFTDYDNWHIILNSVVYRRTEDEFEPDHLQEISDYESRLVLKPSWKRGDWLRAARRDTHNVQGHAEAVNLAKADIIWCRNQPTKKVLIAKGFDEENIAVRRMTSNVF